MRLAVVDPQPPALPVLERLGHVGAKLADHQADSAHGKTQHPLARSGRRPSRGSRRPEAVNAKKRATSMSDGSTVGQPVQQPGAEIEVDAMGLLGEIAQLLRARSR